jgi:methylated-DNA-[protein]-cysteine S-methyltransferase
MPSPIGTLWIAATAQGIVRLSFTADEATFCEEIERTMGTIPMWNPDALADVMAQLAAYFAGKRTTFELPLDLTGTTPFQSSVLRAVAEVPYGEVQSYGDIARAVGNPYAARAVGSVMATNPLAIVIPCHRIVRSDGTHGEYALRSLGSSGSSYKRFLLDLEGHLSAVQEPAR